ncbi:DUF1932 domain-containing protein [Streptomyces sp. NPDC048290]|uniref:NAD(P)-dependent oxidoreductase n=1 Tax=Streptomyces sp. NPDC048290 TaxID=3155811 RepID=UPI0034456125
MIVTVLHPGAMGAAVAAQAAAKGHQVLWVPDGRSTATRDRAEQAGLTACGTLREAVTASDLVLSICPPHAAEAVARQVAAHAYTGVYADANAISPQRMHRITGIVRPATAVDGAILGPPPRDGRTCRLYLAGPGHTTAAVAALFTDTAVETRSAGDAIGSASALKMAFAHFQKTARTLAGLSHALADTHGVAALLTDEAHRMTSQILSDPGYLPSVAARAWRWAPEMEEIADTLDDAGLPTDLAAAAATVLAHWESDKDRTDLTLPETLDHLRHTTNP